MILPQVIQDEIEQGALCVLNHSGGKDSQAMMIKVAEVVPVEQLLVVHASLGRFEWPGALEHAKRQAFAAGVPFMVASAQKSFADMVLRRFNTKPSVPSFPSKKHRQCTSDLKRDPVAKAIRHYIKVTGHTRIVSFMGMRAEESPDRAKKANCSFNKRNSVAGRTWHDSLPIQEMSTVEVFNTIQAAGQQPHYAYGRGNNRLSCLFCIFGSEGDLRNGALQAPDVYAELCALENYTGYSMHQSRRRLIDIVQIDPEPPRIYA